MKRILLAAASMLAALSFSTSGQTANRTPLANFGSPPTAVPLSENQFGVPLDDPYRWMEDPARAAEWQNWVRAASDHTRSQLTNLPGRARLAERLQRLSRASTAYFDLQQAGRRLFYERTDPDATAAKLVVREANGVERVLVDPMSTTGAVAAINNFSPSPSGQRIAFQISEGGGEVGVTRFMDVGSRLLFHETLSPIWGEEGVSWLDDESVLYTRMDPASPDPLQNMTVRLHRVGSSPDSDTVFLSPGHGVEAREFPSAFRSFVSPWVLAFAGGARADARALRRRALDLCAPTALD